MIDNPFGPSFAQEFKRPEHKKEEPKKVVVIKAAEVVIPKNESEHARILREHGGIESNISIRSHYWRIRP
jgi:hypothetical protein